MITAIATDRGHLSVAAASRHVRVIDAAAQAFGQISTKESTIATIRLFRLIRAVRSTFFRMNVFQTDRVKDRVYISTLVSFFVVRSVSFSDRNW